MYGRPSRFCPPSAGWRHPQQQQPPPPQAQFPPAPYPNPNDPLQNLNYLLQSHLGFIPGHQNLNFPMQNSNLPMQNPGFHFPQPPNPGFQPHSSVTEPAEVDARIKPTKPGFQPQSSATKQAEVKARIKSPNQGFQPQVSATRPAEVMVRINHAVDKAHKDLLVAGESVSAWKVSQSSLSILQADSWDYLGLRMQEIDALHRLIVVEGKINSFIHCFVGVRRITTLYELEKAICKNEGVKQFEELRLGPFLRHPLVLHYFSVNSEVTEVFKIKSEEIVSFLSEFIDVDAGRNKNFRVEDFMDFISGKRSVTKREMLGVRVQNLGMHISVIQNARRSEDEILSKYLSKPDEKRRKRPLFSLQKQQLDERFSAISQRVESFSSVHKDFCGKHVRFDSSSSEDEDSNDNTNSHDSSSHIKLSLQSNKSSERTSSCPYPSATEEMTRLGLKGEVSGHATPIGGQKHSMGIGSSKRKRKSRDQSHTVSGSPTLRKKPKIKASILDKVSINNFDEGSNDQAEYKITKNSLRIFIATWKDGCRDLSVAEVLQRMLHHYGIKFRSKKRVGSMLSSYPFIGLLNVAVSSIKNGMWDSIYDSLQTINLHESTNTRVEKQPVYECIDVGPSAEGALIKHVPKSKHGVTVEDIIKKIGEHIKFEQEIHSNDRFLLENRIYILKQLCSCEFWLVEQFSAEDFKSLGHGGFFIFLQKHASMLPDELRKFFMPENSVRSPLEACMLQRQLVNLVSQACYNLSENELISKQMICALLTQQFPFISFKLTENGSLEDFMELVGQQKNNVVSKCVIFSVTLLGTCHVRDSLATMDNDLMGDNSVTAEVGQGLRAIEPVTSEDAMKVLVRAPMLLDLNLWSHWDILFAPALGPLVPWLQNEVNTENLLCIVTKEGKVIRIDHTATADSFLEAALQGSPFHTSVKLLSIFALLGGEKHVPLSLLKHHANNAFEVIFKNSVENTEVFDKWSLGHEKVFCHQNTLEQVAAGNLRCELKKKIDMRNNAIPVLSRFVIDCLCYLPSEFRYLAADILLSGMSSVIKDAASAILHECHKPEQRLMLHEIGFSLGVLEWIQDHHRVSSSSSDLFTDESACLNDRSKMNRNLPIGGILTRHSASEQNVSISIEGNMCNEKISVPSTNCATKICNDANDLSCMSLASEPNGNEDAAQIIQSVRRDEFGLDPDLPNAETGMLRKQHARLGRALHCLSQELYSQDSHFLLELVQNADDNVYPQSVEPTLAFIFEESGIVVLNNEEGFSAKNIKALCDIGNSTKKGSNAGYIGKKGIGFKSVFRVTDAPEIHSNGFHVKFDISEGQIGFVLPTIIPPFNVDLYGRLASNASDHQDTNLWNTCIVLPFRSKLSGGGALINNIVNMFADLHPSLLLFLHRLHCIKIRNLLDNSLIVMRKEIVGNGIIKVSHGEEKMTWLVVSQKLKADVVRHGVQSTEISIAFTLQEEENGAYVPFLDQQPVFAFLPLRMYGLKFIIQGDFVLPSSREEVDGDSPWNQWLLSEFPGLFVSAVKSFCSLPCFESCPGKAIADYMSYIPLIGEVHGFFSSLPRLIISKLRMSNCLLLEGKESEWVPPCKVLRGWNEEALILLPDNLLREHLGLGFLNKDIILSNSLARALGIEEYGPKILVQFMSSLCQKHSSLKSMGLVWLGSCLNVLHNMLLQSPGQTSLDLERNTDLIRSLQKVPLIPLSDGTYSSVAEGTIWLHSDSSNTTVDGKYGLKAFPNLNAKIRVVCPSFLSLFSHDNSHVDGPSVGNVSRMLHRIGVQRLSAHEIIKVHVIPAISDESNLNGNIILMTEYVCFVMTHLLSSCPECHVEKGFIVSELRNKVFILTNHGFKRPVEVPVHFSKEYGNPIDIDKLINVGMSWHEVDDTYLNHPVTNSLSCGLEKWRNFFQEIGITDFVHVVEVNRSMANMPNTIMKNSLWDPELISSGLVVKDWESPELTRILTTLLSKHRNRESCRYLLEVLDTLWDDHLSDKVVGYCISKSSGSSKQFQSAFMSCICDVQWVVSNVDNKLHYPKDLYYDCDAVRSILGASAPYAVPKVRSTKLVRDIGFKTRVTLDDTLDILKVWRTEKPFKTSISQMCTFYTFLWNEMAASKQKIVEEFRSGPFIFVPIVADSRHEDVVSGVFLSPEEVYWHDPIGSFDKIKDVYLQWSSANMVDCPLIKTLCNIYQGLKKFFIDECGIHEYPPLCSYLQILKQLSAVALPSQASDVVLQVLLKWADGLKSGLLSSEDMAYLKECIGSSEFTVLPTEQDKWVSLRPSTGIVCFCDDKRLRQQCKKVDKIHFVYFGDISNSKTEVFQTELSNLLKVLGVPLLSEIVTREAKYYGLRDSGFKTSLMNWALPFAQRYMYSMHPDKYAELKQSGFDILSRLQVIVVEKLFFRNVIKNFGHASEEQVPCSCLLQDNILYTIQDSDSHSLFMEFSRVLFNGVPKLHLANFLHMITTMAETGSTEEQTEFFILNTQKVTTLPKEEHVWSLSSFAPWVETHNLLQTCCSPPVPNDQGSYSKSKNKARNWPPVDWKTAPGFNYARQNGFKTQPASSLPNSNPYVENEFEGIDKQTENSALVSVDTEWTFEDDSSAVSVASILPSNGDNIGELNSHGDVDPEALGSQPDSRGFSWRNQLRTGTPNPVQAMVTGRLGEHVAFKYLTEKFSDTVVQWVNEESETGFPFDIIIGDDENNRQYIEVKSTRSARKDWFDISVREWQFAIEKGESYSIAHVLLSPNNVARVSVFRNPVKSCQLSKLQLAVIMPKQQREYSIVSSS